MGDRPRSGSVLDPSLANQRSDSKLTKEKRSSTELATQMEFSSKIVKMRDLDSVSLSDAATVASQWLELPYQDIRGPLAALQRSKKRVSAVIQTELPFLILIEFSSNQENDPYINQSIDVGCPNTVTPDIHRARWTALFDQMD
ncbi:hypothetical protein HHK36_018678 [Tetracentron sinense]|uniref:Uncharacterized protein n=1 Tax=Tetracentron sinense TaxID=13715 RepID=A0A834YYV7_TETSI|nr:hypothetical protein HHK36_018678 [Tetracentron sinense]